MATSGVTLDDPETVYRNVQEFYSRILKSPFLQATSCVFAAKPPQFIRELLKKVPAEITGNALGCGNPIPTGIGGLRVLDLGSGSGRDCYVAAAMVGANGSVTGIDMLPEQLAVARAHVDEYMKTLGYSKPNLRFVEGYIEFLEKAGIEANSLDLVISNCVVDLSPDKRRVLQGVYRGLREGGEFHFADVFCSRRLPKEVRGNELLLGLGAAGALYVEDFKRLCHEIGFTDPRLLTMRELQLSAVEKICPDMASAIGNLIGEARYFSITWRCFKLTKLETTPEDYGQYAIYKGAIQSDPNVYQLDARHRFEKNLPVRVSGNTAAMLEDSWLCKHFEVYGNRETHYGMFSADIADAASWVITKPSSDQPTAAPLPSCCGTA